MIGLAEGSIAAFTFDRGVWLFCNRIEVEMSQAEANAKDGKFATAARQRVLDFYLETETKSGRFRDPSAMKQEEKVDPSEKNLGSDFFG